MTPQLQQSIKLLQLSTLELEQELEGFLQANPLLERIEEEYLRPNQTSPETPEQAANTEESAPEPLPSSNNDDESWLGEESLYSSATGSFDEEDGGAQDTQGATVSLREYLGAQLGLTRLSVRDRPGEGRADTYRARVVNFGRQNRCLAQVRFGGRQGAGRANRSHHRNPFHPLPD